jgi:hypothetical protein
MLRCEYFSEHFVNLFSSESVCSNIELYKWFCFHGLFLSSSFRIEN